MATRSSAYQPRFYFHTKVVLIFALFSSPLFTPRLVFAQLVINELLPNPAGADEPGEWVELKNTSSDSIDITNYLLKDAKDNTLTISSDYTTGPTTINPSGWLVIYRHSHPKFSLNNSGSESVTLLTPDQTVLDSVTYSGSSEDKSWGRLPDGAGSLTDKLDPTPGQANSPPATPAPTPNPTPKSTPTQTTPTSVNSSSPVNFISNQPAPSSQPYLNQSLSSNKASPAPTSTRSSTLGVFSLSAAPSVSSSPQSSPPASLKHNKPAHPIFFLGSGLLFLLAAASAFHNRV